MARKIDKFWIKHLNISDSEELQGLYSSRPQLKSYISKSQGREYFIYSFINNGYLEIHFYDTNNMVSGNETKNIGKTNNSQNIFSVIVSIVLKELEDRPNRKILIIAPEDKSDFYKKVIQKILKQYNIEKTIKIERIKDIETSEIKTYYILESYEIK